MAGEWSSVRLRDVSELITKGTTPTTLGMQFVAKGVNFIKSESITSEGSIDSSKFAFIDEKTHAALRRSQIEPYDLLFSMAGVYLGKTAMVPPNLVPANTNQAVAIIRLNKSRVNPRFVGYYLRNPSFNIFINNLVGQSAQPNINLGDIGNLEIVLPPLEVQDEIVYILGALDAKIELNWRIDQTLEAIARAIFKCWFIDFDPVCAKGSGEAPDSICSRLGLTPELLALFPDRSQDSELGEIPEGWEVSEVGDVVKVVGGSTPSTRNAEYWDGGTIHWATPKDFSALSSRVLLDTERKITDLGLRQISSGLLPPGTVLMSSRAPIGYLALSTIPISVNQGFIAMLCDGPVSSYYMLHWCEHNLDRIKQRAGGTTFAEISKGAFRPIQLVVPEKGLVDQFDAIVKPIFAMVAELDRESITLAKVRDSLVPKLISGELPVPLLEDEVL